MIELRDGGWSAEQIADALGARSSPPSRQRYGIELAISTRPGAGALTVDLERIVAIDVHTHAERSAHHAAGPGHRRAPRGRRGVLRRPSPPQPTAHEVADYYRERSMLAVVFTVDDEAGMGRAPDPQRGGARGRGGQPRRADPVRERSTRTRASSACARHGA